MQQRWGQIPVNFQLSTIATEETGDWEATAAAAYRVFSIICYPASISESTWDEQVATNSITSSRETNGTRSVMGCRNCKEAEFNNSPGSEVHDDHQEESSSGLHIFEWHGGSVGATASIFIVMAILVCAARLCGGCKWFSKAKRQHQDTSRWRAAQRASAWDRDPESSVASKLIVPVTRGPARKARSTAIVIEHDGANSIAGSAAALGNQQEDEARERVRAAEVALRQQRQDQERAASEEQEHAAGAHAAGGGDRPAAIARPTIRISSDYEGSI
jgi:hypothetical protein